MRLVLHAGTEAADSGAVLRDLVASRRALGAAGVAMPAEDAAAAWREITDGLIRQTPRARSLLSAARETGADVLVLGSDLLGDALASPDEAARLAAFASAEGLDTRIVVVVREQVGYINFLYCQRVLSLETARGLNEFAEQAVPAHRFDYVASFGAIADTDGLELVAVPYPDLWSKGPGRAFAGAAGLDDRIVSLLPAPGAAPPPLAGPVLIGAIRLLHKRFRRLNAFVEEGKPRLREVAAQLVARAAEAGWDDSEYWGWDLPMRRAIESEYSDSNAAFAEFVWGGPWSEPWTNGRPHRVDLADLEPAMLRDVLRTVDRLVDEAIQRSPDPSDD